jgi:hypothetical protein
MKTIQSALCGLMMSWGAQAQVGTTAIAPTPGPVETPVALCAKLSEARAACSTSFLRTFPAAISDRALPQAVTNIFVQGRSATNRLGGHLKDIDVAQTRLRSFIDLAKKTNIRKEERDSLLTDLAADLALLEREKTRILDLQAVLVRFLGKFESSWLNTLNIGVQVWGPERALATLRKTLDQEYTKLKADIDALDRPAAKNRATSSQAANN